MELTPQEIQLFRHNGFIKFPTQLPKDHVEALKAAALKDMAEGVEPVARQDGRIIRISAIWERGGIFRETITSDKILDPLESLLGSDIEYVLNRHNHVYLRDAGFKPFAGVASGCPPLVPDNRDCLNLLGRNKFRERLHTGCPWLPPSACLREY